MSSFHNITHNFVLIHIPKTGGWSMRKGSAWGEWGRAHQGSLPKCNPKFKLAFIRHPIERFLSAYRMFTEGREELLGLRTCGYTPEQFLRVVLDASIDYRRPSPTDVNIRHHTVPMTHSWNCIDKADHIFKFEDYESNWSKIADMLSIPTPSIEKLNVSKASTKLDTIYSVLSPESIEELNKYYREDYIKFGYEAPDPHRR